MWIKLMSLGHAEKWYPRNPLPFYWVTIYTWSRMKVLPPVTIRKQEKFTGLNVSELKVNVHLPLYMQTGKYIPFQAMEIASFLNPIQADSKYSAAINYPTDVWHLPP
jgi:hypothetical protein